MGDLIKDGQGRDPEELRQDGRVVGLAMVCIFFLAVGVLIGRVL